MTPNRLRTLTGAAALSTVLLLAACGDRTPEAGSGQTPQDQAPGDTDTAAADNADAQSVDSAAMPADVAPADPSSETGELAMLHQIAGLGGAMHAAVELCDPGIGPAQLAEARERQLQEFVRLGGDAAVFEREFTKAHAGVRAQHAGATPAQQSQMCAELEAMATQPMPTPQN